MHYIGREFQAVNHLLRFVLLGSSVCVSNLSAAENLLQDPGFESPLDPAWDKRTPEDAQRVLHCVANERLST